MTILLLILAPCFYSLSKTAWRRWHDSTVYREVPAVVTDWERYTEDLSEVSPLWRGSLRRPRRIYYRITLEADGKLHTVMTERLYGAVLRKGTRTRLFVPADAALPPQLPVQRVGLWHFLGAAFLCAVCSVGVIVMAFLYAKAN